MLQDVLRACVAVGLHVSEEYGDGLPDLGLVVVCEAVEVNGRVGCVGFFNQSVGVVAVVRRRCLPEDVW